MKKIFCDLELAKLLEQEAAIDDANYVDALIKLFPEKHYAKREFTGGCSLFAGNSPFSGTQGFGTITLEHHSARLSEIESFFAGHAYPSILSVASVVDPSIWSLLQNYRIELLRNAYICAPEASAIFTTQSYDIREAKTEAEITTWRQVVTDGFAGVARPEPDLCSKGQSVKKGNRLFLAYSDNQAVAASTLYLRNDYARLGGMTTLAEHRGQGWQKVMIAHRVDTALSAGCQFITSDTLPGNGSQRNLERMGFKVAYVRTILKKS